MSDIGLEVMHERHEIISDWTFKKTNYMQILEHVTVICDIMKEVFNRIYTVNPL